MFGECDVTHSSGCKSDDDASEEGEVIAWVSPVPHGWQQEGCSSGVVGTTFITHPTRQHTVSHIIKQYATIMLAYK